MEKRSKNMSMSYCRFENTYGDLRDCYNALSENESLSEREKNYALKLYRTCRSIAEEFDEEFIESLFAEEE